MRAPNWRRRDCRQSPKLRISTHVSSATASTAVTISRTSYCSRVREAVPVEHASNSRKDTALQAATVSAVGNAQGINWGALRQKSKTENRTMGFPGTRLHGLINQQGRGAPIKNRRAANENWMCIS